MKKFLLYVLVCSLAFSSLMAGEKKDSGPEKNKAAADSTKIIWHAYDVGMKKARETNKHIMVNFTTSWCKFCKKMQKETFSQPEVIKILNEDFVAIIVDGDSKKELNIDGYKITEKDLTKAEYRVTGYPTYWFLNSNGDRIAPLPGYNPPDRFLDVLYFVKEDLYREMSFQEYVKNGGRKSLN